MCRFDGSPQDLRDVRRRAHTLLIFTSEQGSGFPFAKWTCYENGLKTAFIARWPAAIKPGTRTPAMCQYIDVVPTFIEMAGGDPTLADTGISSALDGDRNLDGRSFDGRSFLGVLLGRSEEHRKQVFGVHTTRGIIDGSKSYPVRSVRDARYKYIRNLNHSEAFTGLVLSDGGVYRAWREAAEADPKLRPRVRLISRRPAEELYDLANDPYELNNLAADDQLLVVKQRLGKELERWMEQQGDRGEQTELKVRPR